jgi:hypothetical protein
LQETYPKLAENSNGAAFQKQQDQDPIPVLSSVGIHEPEISGSKAAHKWKKGSLDLENTSQLGLDLPKEQNESYDYEPQIQGRIFPIPAFYIDVEGGY